MILVSGGTGFVGSAVTRELLKRGEQVAVLGRDAGKIERLFGGEAEARVGDVRKPEELASAMSGADVVINAVQIPTSPIEVPRRGWTFEEVDYKGTVNQVDAAKAAGVKRFLYVSGVGVAPGSPQHWFRLKWQAEQYLINSGLEWTVVRPTWVFGPDDWALNRLLNFTNFLPFLPFFGDGKQAMQPVFVEDLGRVIADAALAPAAANQLFEAGGPDVMTMNDVLKTALEVKGRKRFILHQPVFVGKIAGTLASLQPFVTPPLTADAVDFVCSPATADTANLERVLQPQMTPLRAALETYLKK
jgi:NADH dehydrogenase